MAQWKENSTTFLTVKKEIAQFLMKRDWEKQHTPKNLAMSIAIEAAELMEIFQWVASEHDVEMVDDAEVYEHIQEEVADVMIYCFSLARTLDFDLAAAIQDKIKKNGIKYPVPQHHN